MNINGNFPSYEQQQQALTLLQEIGVDIDTLLAGHVVKSTQRGVHEVSSGAATVSEISISSVNPLKSIVILNGSSLQSSSVHLPNLYSLTSDKLSIQRRDDRALGTFSWQVIEFY